MTVYLVRHGEAESVGPAVSRDADRKLTGLGAATAKLMGQVLSRIDPQIDAILTSPLLRAQQTGEILRHELHDQPVLNVSENLSPGFQQKELLRELLSNDADSRIVAVGHQPDLSRLIGFLIADSPLVAVAMAPLALAKIDIEGRPPDHRAQLSWLLTPETVDHIHSLSEGERS